MSRLKLSFLGAFQVALDGEPVRTFRSIKAQALLAYLATESNRPHSREILADLFWPSNPISARQNLRQTLRRLRLALGDGGSQAARSMSFLFTTRRTLQFNRGSDHWLDVAEFLACLEQGQWERAVALYRGPFLEGLCLDDGGDFEGWVTLVREQLHCQALGALGRLAQRYQSLADHERAQTYARRQLALDPWQEQAHRQLILALASSGQRGAALAQYEVYRRSLVEGLGLEPSAETAALYAHIRDG